MKFESKNSYETPESRKRLAEFLAYTIEGSNLGEPKCIPYNPNEGDDSFWVLDSGNNWRLTFDREAPNCFEIYHRYNKPEVGNDMVERLASWLLYRITGLKIVNISTGDEGEKQKLNALIEKGYTVVVVSPFAVQFGTKYKVFQDPQCSKVVTINMYGDVIALQG